MGLFTRSTKLSDDLLEHGIRGSATVEKAEMRGVLGVTEYSGAGVLTDGEFETQKAKILAQ